MITSPVTSPEAGFATRRGQHPESSALQLFSNTWVQTKRLLIRWGRDPVTLLMALILPILLLLVLDVVLGNFIYFMTHDNALYSIVPLITLGAAISGSAYVAIDLIRERSDGLLSRLWVLPVHRASGLLARVVAEGVRILVTTLVILGVAVLLGFRFRQGPAESLMWIGVPVVFSMAFAVLTTTVALYAVETLVVEAVELMQMALIFFSTGLVPMQQFPRWVQPVVAHQPVSYAAATMRGLSTGGPIASPLIATLLWSAGIVAACVVPLVVGYRRACTR